MNEVEDLGDLITRHAGTGITETAISGVYVMRSETTTDPLGVVSRPSLAFVIGGAKIALLGDDQFAYGAGEYLIVGLELPITGHISAASADEPFLAAGLDLRPERIASLLLEAGPAGLPSERRPLGLAVSEADVTLLSALRRLLGLLDQPGDIPGLAPAYEREILWRVLTGPHGHLLREIGLADGRLTTIAGAIRFIRDHYSEAIRIEELADLSAMSPATLHRHFRAVTNMTPIQFQKQLRLQRARNLLMVHPDDVAGAGFSVGYESASQFNREYRRMFGLSPGRDAHLRRTAVSGAVQLI
jgi:AraC-like DNA-binding protein